MSSSGGKASVSPTTRSSSGAKKRKREKDEDGMAKSKKKDKDKDKDKDKHGSGDHREHRGSSRLINKEAKDPKLRKRICKYLNDNINKARTLSLSLSVHSTGLFPPSGGGKFRIFNGHFSFLFL